jgi:hypothetical protein
MRYSLLLLVEKSAEQTWLFWIIGVALATLALWNSFKGNLNVVSASRP